MYELRVFNSELCMSEPRRGFQVARAFAHASRCQVLDDESQTAMIQELEQTPLPSGATLSRSHLRVAGLPFMLRWRNSDTRTHLS